MSGNNPEQFHREHVACLAYSKSKLDTSFIRAIFSSLDGSLCALDIFPLAAVCTIVYEQNCHMCVLNKPRKSKR